jgi:hypothetical protein
MDYWIIQIQRLTHGYQHCLILDVFRNDIINVGYYHIKLAANAQKLYVAMGYQDYLVLEITINLMSKLVQDMEYVETYLDDLVILINRNNSFKDHLLKLEMVLARLSAHQLLV